MVRYTPLYHSGLLHKVPYLLYYVSSLCRLDTLHYILCPHLFSRNPDFHHHLIFRFCVSASIASKSVRFDRLTDLIQNGTIPHRTFIKKTSFQIQNCTKTMNITSQTFCCLLFIIISLQLASTSTHYKMNATKRSKNRFDSLSRFRFSRKCHHLMIIWPI